MQLKLKALLFAAVFNFSGATFADSAISSSSAESTQVLTLPSATSQAVRTIGEACQLAKGDRCPACCTGCGTDKKDCSACKPQLQPEAQS